jgi:DNA-binding NarL/FixJ family response regulator/class 3 adenylate cyclase
MSAMERRIVAVMFTDLVRSTELFDRLSAEQAEEVRRSHFDALREVVEASAGETVKTLGDGIMAVFGLASAAMDCAVAAQRRFSVKDMDISLAGLRAGIAVGEATVEGDDYHGPPVVEAARLCSAASPGQILSARTVRQVVGRGSEHAFEPVEPLTLRGFADPLEADVVVWTPPDTAAPRVLLADDAVVVRQGIARVLEDDGFQVVGQAGDAEQLLQLTAELLPDVVVTDIRMPPSFELEGLQAAMEIRRRFPNIGVLVLSQHVVTEYAVQLLGEGSTGVGYLLKERITAIDAFTAAVRRVAGGGTAVDPEIVAALMDSSFAEDPLGALTEREREVLSLMAQGLSNTGIAERLVVSPRTVESHVAGIFEKLDIPPESQDDRRVQAVLRHLEF